MLTPPSNGENVTKRRRLDDVHGNPLDANICLLQDQPGTGEAVSAAAVQADADAAEALEKLRAAARAAVDSVAAALKAGPASATASSCSAADDGGRSCPSSVDGVPQLLRNDGGTAVASQCSQSARGIHDVAAEADMLQECRIPTEHVHLLQQGVARRQLSSCAGSLAAPAPLPAPTQAPDMPAMALTPEMELQLQQVQLQQAAQQFADCGHIPTFQQEGWDVNGLGMNGFATAGLASNGLALNGLAPEGLALTALPPSSLTPNGLASGDLMATQVVEQAEDPAISQLYNTLYALAQLAEESAQMAASAAAFCASPGTAEATQVVAVSEAAQQAAQRAAWAASTMATYETVASASGQGEGWVLTMKQIAKQASEAAEQAAQDCKCHANMVENASLQQHLGDKKSKVPCKFNQMGRRCHKGAACEFSHDPADLQPRPLMLKSEKECIFFVKGQCTRGAACPFAHGEEEKAEISRYVMMRRSGR